MNKIILLFVMTSLFAISCVDKKAVKTEATEIKQNVEYVSKEIKNDLMSLDNEVKELEKDLEELDNL